MAPITQEQAKPEVAQQFTQAEVKLTINALPNIPETERAALIRETSQIFTPKSSNELAGSDHTKLTERDILNQLRLNSPSLSNSTLTALDASLDTKRQSLQSLRDVKVMVIETDLQDPSNPFSHSRIVESIITDENKSLKQENIIQLGLREAGGSVEGLQRAAQMSTKIQAAGGAPPVVNMSLEVGSMINLKSEQRDGSVVRGDITAKQLGYPDNVTVADIAKDPEDLRRRLTELATKGNKDAKQTLAEADAILELANTGATVNVAWGNNDKVNVVGLLTQGHAKVNFVAAVDGHNQPSQNLNPTTGNAAEVRRNGNVLLVADTAKGNVDPTSADGARVIYVPIDNPKSPVGKDPKTIMMTDQEINTLASQITAIRQLDAAISIKANVQGAMESIRTTGEISYVAKDQLLINQKGLENAIQRAGLPALGDATWAEDLTAILKNPQHAAKLMNQLQADVSAATPPGVTISNTTSIDQLCEQTAKPLQGKIMTPEQYKRLFGEAVPNGVLPSDSKRDTDVYVSLTNPSIAISSTPSPDAIKAYQTVKLKNGSSMLALPTEGTSFAAPTQTGIDSKR